MGWRVRGSTGIVPRRKSSPHSMNSMPRCDASNPTWLARASSIVGLPNQIAIVTPATLLAVFLADAAICLAERDAFARDQRIRFLGGVNGGVEFDLVGTETHAIDGNRHDAGGGEREVYAAEQRRLDELQVTLVSRGQL